MNSDQLSSLLNQIAGGKLSEDEIIILRAELLELQNAVASGDRAIAVSGNIDKSIIITGDMEINLYISTIVFQITGN